MSTKANSGTYFLSVVVPLYNEEDNLLELHKRITAVVEKLTSRYELIFVNDGSKDTTLAMAIDLSHKDSHVLLVDLARNFGHQIAISAGIAQAQGDAVIVMDGDLQDTPETIPRFIDKWAEGYEVVYAVREKRKENSIKRASYALFYRLLKKLSTIDIPLDAGDFSLMDKKIVSILTSMPERNRFVRGLRSWIGFKQIGIPVERAARYAGKPKYTFSKLVSLAFDGLVSFSYVPLRFITVAGFGVSVLSILLAVYYLFDKLLGGSNPAGFPTLIVSILFLAGIQLITIGVIGEYVGRIYEEVKQRPLFIIRHIYR